MTPGTTSAAPWSPPIASNATRTTGSAVGVAAAAHRLRRHCQPALVVAAVRADAVRQLHLVAVRTLLEAGQVDREVRAALALPGVRDASLGYTHGVSWAPCRSSWGACLLPAGARGRERGSRRRRSLPRNAPWCLAKPPVPPVRAVPVVPAQPLVRGTSRGTTVGWAYKRLATLPPDGTSRVPDAVAEALPWSVVTR